MSSRKDFYFRQRVTEGELDSAFDDLENADHNLAADLGFTGVLANAVVSQHAPVPDLTVDVSGPGAILDQLGQRIFFSALQNVNVAQDESGVSTAVSTAGKERTVSVFVKFDRALSDPRVDGNSLTVFFRRDESFKFIVAQGAEADAGTALPPPLRSDAILLGDVTRRFGQTQVLASDISIARRQDALVLAGSPRSVRRGRTIDALNDLLVFFNALTNGTGDRLNASAVDYAAGPSWADGTANPPTTVQAQLDKIVSDLAARSGAPKVGADATAAAPNALKAGSVKSQLDALLGFLNAHLNQASGAHAASAVSFAGGPAWADGTANPATTVEAQLEKEVSDLADVKGADKIGAAVTGLWADGTGVSASRVRAALDAIISALAAADAGADGVQKVGGAAADGAPNSLAAGTARSQLNALLGFINAHINSAGTSHPASAISYAGGGAWADGTTNPATDVETQLDKIVSDLAVAAGGGRVGYAAPVGESLAANSVKGGLDRAATRGLRRNFIHNGNFCVWRRNGNYATSDLTFAPTRTYLVDRWYLVSNNGSSGNGQVDLYPIVDGGSLEKSGLVLNKYGAGTNEVLLAQEIERVDVQHLAGKTVGLSFRVGRLSSLPAGGVFRVLLIAGTGNTGQVLTTPYTGQTTVIDSGVIMPPLGSFQTYSFTGTVPANATTLAVKISYIPTGNSAGEVLNLQWLSLVIGAPATEFDYAAGSRAGEYDLCRFYYENSYENCGLATPGYSNGRVGFGISLPGNGNAANINFLVGVLRMQDKRARPTIRLWAIGFFGDTPGRLSEAPLGGGINASFACTATDIGTNEFELYVPVGASPALDLNGNKTIYGEWDADADY